ncbi:hypothetical protein [Bacillus cereus]|uniref:hypothetical protein n=1 Tax=Bacillus cereus TaxID=1396 RepID=UPI00269E9414
MDSSLYFLLNVGFFQNAGGTPLRNSLKVKIDYKRFLNIIVILMKEGINVALIVPKCIYCKEDIKKDEQALVIVTYPKRKGFTDQEVQLEKFSQADRFFKWNTIMQRLLSDDIEIYFVGSSRLVKQWEKLFVGCYYYQHMKKSI